MLDALFLVLIVFDAKLDDKPILFKILWVLQGVPAFTASAVTYLQVYEWISMIIIIKFQKNKPMAQIMYEVNNSEKFIIFQSKERILKYFSIVMIIAVYLYGAIAYYIHKDT